MELAKQQADKPDEEDREMRKKLWLRIGMTDQVHVWCAWSTFVLIQETDL